MSEFFSTVWTFLRNGVVALVTLERGSEWVRLGTALGVGYLLGRLL